MIDVIMQILGLDPLNHGLDPNLVFVTCSFLVFYSLCYMFNFFQILMERLTAKKGR